MNKTLSLVRGISVAALFVGIGVLVHAVCKAPVDVGLCTQTQSPSTSNGCVLEFYPVHQNRRCQGAATQNDCMADTLPIGGYRKTYKMNGSACTEVQIGDTELIVTACEDGNISVNPCIP